MSRRTPKGEHNPDTILYVHFVFAEKCLEEHNVLRRLHKNTPDLVWDDKLADIAQQYAEHLAERVDFRHSSVGENMYMKINSGKSTLSSCFDATLAW